MLELLVIVRLPLHGCGKSKCSGCNPEATFDGSICHLRDNFSTFLTQMRQVLSLSYLISFEKCIIIGECYAHECWSAIDNDFIINIVHGDSFDDSLIFFSDDWCIDSPYASDYKTFNDSNLTHFKTGSLDVTTW